MRHLDAEIIVEPLRGGLRLRLVCATGEKFYIALRFCCGGLGLASGREGVSELITSSSFVACAPCSTCCLTR